MRSTWSRARLLLACRSTRSRARPKSAPSSIALNVLEVMRGRWPLAASQSPIHVSLRPPPYASAVSKRSRPSDHAASIRSNACSRVSPCPKKAGAEPIPPKLPQPRTTRIAAHPTFARIDPATYDKEPAMPVELPPLPSDFSALEPHIDARTMEIHHDKHHQAYVDNANKALDGTEWADRPVENVLAELDVMPEAIRTAVRNNAGGHANHSLFWQIMGPDGGGEPAGGLADAINDTFGGLDQLKEQVVDGGVKRFGSGWTWLVWDGTGLAVYSTPNQDSPIMQSDVPLLGIDVWEHAYYLNYQNRRPDYLAAWWNVVNWAEVARRFDEAR